MVMLVGAVREALRLLGERRKGRWVLLVLLALLVTLFETVGAH